MIKTKLFFASLFLTMGVVLVLTYLNRPSKHTGPDLLRINNNIFLTSQLEVKDVLLLKSREIKTIVDMRPDGEAKDQPSSADIASAAEREGIGFHYIPVPHDTIPEPAVESLHQVLSREDMPALLYCRTGRRAVRLYALEEASRPSGPDATAIEEMVRNAGFSVDDLKDDIVQRISHRSEPESVKP